MENLKKNLEEEKQYLFKCSQCNKMLDLSGKIYYCKNCKSNYCEDCLKGHNEIFFDHDIHQTKEDFEPVVVQMRAEHFRMFAHTKTTSVTEIVGLIENIESLIEKEYFVNI